VSWPGSGIGELEVPDDYRWGYSLQAPVKTKEGADRPDRDAQFRSLTWIEVAPAVCRLAPRTVEIAAVLDDLAEVRTSTRSGSYESISREPAGCPASDAQDRAQDQRAAMGMAQMRSSMSKGCGPVWKRMPRTMASPSSSRSQVRWRVSRVWVRVAGLAGGGDVAGDQVVEVGVGPACRCAQS